MSHEAPETNLIKLLLGHKVKTVKSRIVSTDYTDYALAYRCNDDDFFQSHDEYFFLVRNEANGPSVLNSIIQRENNSTDVMMLAAFPKVNHSNPLCSSITMP